MKAPYTERYVRCCERTAVSHRLLLDFQVQTIFLMPDMMIIGQTIDFRVTGWEVKDMRDIGWIRELRMVLIIVAVIAIVLLVTHSEEIGDWMMEEMTGGVESDLEQILG